MAVGTACWGFADSPAVTPTLRDLISGWLLNGRAGTYISVPAYNVPATTNVLATPLIESANAPGLSQYLNPIVWGPIPPALIQIARMKNTMRASTLILWESALPGKYKERNIQ